MKARTFKVKSYASKNELSLRDKLFNLFKDNPIPDEELLLNIGLFTNRQTLSRMLWMNELYQNIVHVQGIVIEFGVRWGQTLALFESFRGMYEPFNYKRKIVGFDTFKGFPSTDVKDGKSDAISVGAYAVAENYEEYLKQILDYHEQESPLAHIKKYELVKGDATLEIENYLDKNPHTVIALAYFDFDLYEPTKKCLESIRGCLTKGSILAFDDLNHRDFPGQTLAIKEVFGLDKFKIMRSELNPMGSYLIVE